MTLKKPSLQILYRGLFSLQFVIISFAACAQWAGNSAPQQGQTETYSFTKTSTWGSTVQWSPTMGSVMSQWLSGDRLTAYANIRWNSVGPSTLTVRNGAQYISQMAVEVQCPVMYAPTFSVQRLSGNPAASSNGCVNASFQINATIGSGGSAVRWYNSSSDTQPFHTGASLNTGALASSRTYWISTFYFESNGGVSVSSMPQQMQMAGAQALKPPPGGGTTVVCESQKIPVTINIYPVPVVTLSVETPTLCSGTMNQIFIQSQGGLGSEVSANWWASYPADISGGAGSGTNRVEEVLRVERLNNQPQTVTYYASITANGCTGSTGSASVSVIPIPDAAAAAQAICTGETTSITITTPKGVPNTSFTWTAAPSGNVSGAASGSTNLISQTLSNTSATNGTVTYTITPKVWWCTGPTATVVATVKPRPTLGINNTVPTFCAGLESKVYLSSNVSNTQYSWTASAANISGSSSSGLTSTTGIFQTLYATTNTSGTVTYSIASSANGCAGSSGNATVTVKPLPTASATGQTICSGQPVSVSISNPNSISGTTYSWTPVSVVGVTNISGGSGSPIQRTPTATTSSQGSFYWAITPSANGCTGAVFNVQMLVDPNPPLPGGADVVTQTSAPVVLTATGAMANETYRWYPSNDPLAAHVGSLATFTTPTLSQTYTSYYASRRNTVTGCEGARKEIKAVYSPPQPLNGESPAYAAMGIYQYSFAGDWSLQNTEWVITNGEILTETNSPDWYTRTARVRWFVPGSGVIKLKEKNSTWIHADKTVTVICPTIASPVLTEVAVHNGSSFVSSPSGSCGPGMIRLTAAPGSGGGTILWFESQTGGTGVSGLSITTNGSISSTKTYWMLSQNTISGCVSSPRIAAAAPVNTPPAGTPAVSGSGRFGEGTLALSASGTPSGGSYRWVNNVTGQNVVSASYTTPSLSADQTNYLTVKNVSAEGCDGPAISVNIDIEPLPVVSASDMYIVHSRPVTLMANAGYDTYTWKDNSGATVGTGVSFDASAAGSYYVVVTKAGITGSASSSEASVSAQLENQNINFISEARLNSPVTDRNAIASLPIGQVYEKIQYFDGLGRLIQTVRTQASPSHKDIVLPAGYDGFGREQYKYLPFTAQSNGRFKSGVVNAVTHDYEGVAAGFYNMAQDAIPDDAKPYAVTVFDKSPLNRILKNGSYGETWQPNTSSDDLNDHTVKKQYGFNDENEILLWTFDPLTGSISANDQNYLRYYQPHQLRVEKTYDENNSLIMEYVDKNDKIVAKKAQAVQSETSPVYAMTYFIYDDAENLVTVIPPAGVERLSEYHDASAPAREQFLNKWAFRYSHDGAKRLVSKKVPGAGKMNMVYDDRDRLVLSQDGNQRKESSPYWLFSKYDAHDRLVATGKYFTTDTLIASVQLAVDTYYANLSAAQARFETYVGGQSGNILGYTNKSFPQVNAETDYLTVRYYDKHDSYNAPSGFAFEPLLPEQTTNSSYPHLAGHLVASLAKRLDSNTWLRTVHYYNEKYRNILTISEYTDGKTLKATHYDFTGKPVTTLENYVVGATQTRFRESFSYDHAGRVREKRHRLNDTDEIIAQATQYNEVGQLISRKIHSTDAGVNFSQHVDYGYNIRKWLTRINHSDLSPDNINEPKDFFGMELSYEQVTAAGNTPVFNGNVSAVRWNSEVPGKQSSYNYIYDPLNRVTEARFSSSANGTQWNLEADKFNSTIQYDLNGNILALTRANGKPRLLDNLTYSYTGNRLDYIDDSGDRNNGFIEGNFYYDDLAYDANGNMKQDLNRGITDVTYNFFGLTDQVTSQNGDRVSFVYDSEGNKLGQRVYDEEDELVEETSYMGRAVVSDGAVNSISHDDGQILTVGNGTFEHQYNLEDNTENIRVVFTTTPDIDTVLSTFETDHLHAEVGQFTNHSRVHNDFFDHTDQGTSKTYSQRLLGGNNSTIGLAKSLEVMPGDSVTVIAYAKYFDPAGSSSTGIINIAGGLINAFNIPAVAVGELGAYHSVNSFFSGGPAILSGGLYPWEDASAPKAYLNILVFNKNHQIVDFAFDQISADADQPLGDPAKHDHDELLLKVRIEEPGYVYIYLSNENPEVVEVYFDDVMVAHRYSDVIQRDDYYPFGVSISETALQKKNPFYKGSSYANRFGYKDLGYRRFDPYSGRFYNPDPLAEMQFEESPYQYAKNNPIRLIDAWGLISSTVSTGETSTDELRNVSRENPGAQAAGGSGVGEKFAKSGGPGTRAKLKVFWQKLTHTLRKIFSSQRIRGSFFNSAGGPRTGKSGDKNKDSGNNSGGSHEPRPNMYGNVSVTPGGNDANSGADDRPRNMPTNWNTAKNDYPDDPVTDHNEHHGRVNPNDPMIRKLNAEFKQSEGSDAEALSNAQKQGGPVLAAQLQKLNSDEKAKVHQDQTNMDSFTAKPDEILLIVEKIKQAIANGSTSTDLTDEIRATGLQHSPTVVSVSTIVGRLQIGTREVEIEIVPAGNITFPESRFIVSPEGEARENYSAFDGHGKYVEYIFNNAVGGYHHITIVVNDDDAYTFADYVGLSSETDRLITTALPDNLSNEQRSVYKQLLNNARSSDGLSSNMSPGHFQTDQVWEYTGKTYTVASTEVLNEKGEKEAVSEVGSKKQCWTATKEMIENSGRTSGSSTRVYQVAMEDKATRTKLITNQDQYKKGLKSILDHLSSGRGVQIGVNYRFGSAKKADGTEFGNVGNHNQSTDHYVVITSAKYDENGNLYFEVYDPATSWTNKGTSADNRLYLIEIEDGFVLKGKSRGIDYEVTEIRPNGDFPAEGTIDLLKQKPGPCETLVCY